MQKILGYLLSLCSLPVLGMVLTANYLLLVYWRFHDRFFQLEEMPLNEVGDFLAGVFGPVAFGWLIIGYLMQNKELKNSVEQTGEAQRLALNQLEFQKSIEAVRIKEKNDRVRPIFDVDYRLTMEQEAYLHMVFARNEFDDANFEMIIKIKALNNDAFNFSLYNQYQLENSKSQLSFIVRHIDSSGIDDLKIGINSNGFKDLDSDGMIEMKFSYYDVDGKLNAGFLCFEYIRHSLIVYILSNRDRNFRRRIARRISKNGNHSS